MTTAKIQTLAHELGIENQRNQLNPQIAMEAILKSLPQGTGKHSLFIGLDEVSKLGPEKSKAIVQYVVRMQDIICGKNSVDGSSYKGDDLIWTFVTALDGLFVRNVENQLISSTGRNVVTVPLPAISQKDSLDLFADIQLQSVSVNLAINDCGGHPRTLRRLWGFVKEYGPKKELSYNDILKKFEDAFGNSITTNPPAFQALVPVLRGSMVELEDKLGTEQANTLVSNGTYENALVDVKKGCKFIPRISALRLFLFVSHKGNPKVFIDTNIETPLIALRKVRDLLSRSISPEDQIFHHIYSMLNPSKWDKPSTGLEEFFAHRQAMFPSLLNPEERKWISIKEYFRGGVLSPDLEALHISLPNCQYVCNFSGHLQTFLKETDFIETYVDNSGIILRGESSPGCDAAMLVKFKEGEKEGMALVAFEMRQSSVGSKLDLGDDVFNKLMLLQQQTTALGDHFKRLEISFKLVFVLLSNRMNNIQITELPEGVAVIGYNQMEMFLGSSLFVRSRLEATSLPPPAPAVSYKNRVEQVLKAQNISHFNKTDLKAFLFSMNKEWKVSDTKDQLQKLVQEEKDQQEKKKKRPLGDGDKEVVDDDEDDDGDEREKRPRVDVDDEEETKKRKKVREKYQHI
jgi:hypothetical protein